MCNIQNKSTANKLNEKCKYDIVLIGFYTSVFNIINKLTLNNLDNIELKLREDRKSYLNYIQGYFGCKVIKLLNRDKITTMNDLLSFIKTIRNSELVKHIDVNKHILQLDNYILLY